MDKISKSDLISFIGFLRERDITIVPYTQTYFSIFNGRCTRDCTNTIRNLADYFKTHTPEEAYIKGPKILGQNNLILSGVNCNQKLMPNIIYSEDLEEYLEMVIENEKERIKMFKLICTGNYKTYYRRKKYPLFSDEFDLWAKGCKCAPLSRNIWTERFCFDFEFWLDIYYHHCKPDKIVFSK